MDNKDVDVWIAELSKLEPARLKLLEDFFENQAAVVKHSFRQCTWIFTRNEKLSPALLEFMERFFPDINRRSCSKYNLPISTNSSEENSVSSSKIVN
jgi:hypothetical protein